jgi:hypothetical protein
MVGFLLAACAELPATKQDVAMTMQRMNGEIRLVTGAV